MRKLAGAPAVLAARYPGIGRIANGWPGRLWSSIAIPFHRSIRVRFRFALGLAIIGLGLMATVTLLSNRALMGAYETSILEARSEMAPANAIEMSLHQASRLVQRYAAGGDQSIPARFDAIRNVIDGQFGLLLKTDLEFNHAKHAHSNISIPDVFRAWKAAEATVGKVFSYNAGTPQAAGAALRANLAIGLVFDEISEFDSLAMRDLQESLRSGQAIIYRSHFALFGAILAGLCLLIGLSLITSRSIIDPIAELREAALKLGMKDFSHRVTLRNTQDELGKVAEAFNFASANLQKLYRELDRRSTHDGLTGVLNRASFDELLFAECNSADRHKRPLSLLMIDIDFFKRMNDDYGHQVGDRVLRDVARLLAQETRSGDVLVRYGGEEFAVILPEADEGSVAAMAERFRRTVETAEFEYGGIEKMRVTVSVGCATRRPLGSTIDDFVKTADEALYRAKKAGRNRVVSAREPLPAGQRAGRQKTAA